MLKSFRQTVATPRKCPGRASPSGPPERPSTSTHVSKPSGIHLGGRRHEEEVDAGRLGESRVRRLVARVALEVLPFAELGRVDEDRGDDQVVLAARRIEERDVPGVERAHRGDEPDAFPRKGLANFGDRAERPHGVFAPRSAASVSASAR